MQEYVAPQLDIDGFNCPHCGAYAHQTWEPLVKQLKRGALQTLSGWLIATCARCSDFSVWCGPNKVYPSSATAPLAHPDMPSRVKQIYEEARTIHDASPRGAAALLRLALQMLMVDLGQKGKNINEDIAELVKKGLPVQVQQALDIVRIVGNNAVHPGQIDINDSPAISTNMFQLINIIIEKMISEPKHLQEIFNSLPQPAIEQIAKRDGGTP